MFNCKRFVCDSLRAALCWRSRFSLSLPLFQSVYTFSVFSRIELKKHSNAYGIGIWNNVSANRNIAFAEFTGCPYLFTRAATKTATFCATQPYDYSQTAVVQIIFNNNNAGRCTEEHSKLIWRACLLAATEAETRFR